MAIEFKKEPKYPSTSKPGIFYYNPDSEELWEEYTGIDDIALDKYKFAIGTWEEISKQNRVIKLHKFEELDFVNLNTGDVSNAPSDPPTGYQANTVENATEIQPKPPEDSRDFTENIFEDLTLTIPVMDSVDNETYDLYIDKVNTVSSEDDLDKGITSYHTYGQKYNNPGIVGQIHRNHYNIGLAMKGRLEWDDVSLYYDAKRKGGWAYVHSSLPGFKQDTKPIVNSNGTGPWCLARVPYRKRVSRIFDNSGIWWQFKWKPNLIHERYTRAGQYSEDFNYQWDGEKWISGKFIIDESVDYKKTEDVFVGVPLISIEKPKFPNSKLAINSYDGNNLPVFYNPNSSNYTNSTAPLKIWFGIDTFLSDENTGTDLFKFYVVEWGDEDIKMSNEQILNSEYFSLYNVGEDNFDRAQTKKLFAVINNSKSVTDESGFMDFYQHTYTEPGIYSIKTLIFRIRDTGEPNDVPLLFQTKMINTNIVVNDAEKSLEEFDVFGANDFKVLPVSLEKRELMIGGLDKESNYVKSIKKIEKDDLYDSEDYLEKKYNEKVLPLIEQSMYGDHLNKIDLSTTRLFTKPYDLSYFLNSKATDILIDDSDCIIEINPSEVDQNIIENTARSSYEAVLIGDYKLIKKEKQKMRKEDSMDISKIETRKENQAF